MSVYKCIAECADHDGKPDGFTFWIRANFGQPSGQIEYSMDGAGADEAWRSTPYQVADACHASREAASLVAQYVCDLGGDEYPERVTVKESS